MMAQQVARERFGRGHILFRGSHNGVKGDGGHDREAAR